MRGQLKPLLLSSILLIALAPLTSAAAPDPTPLPGSEGPFNGSVGAFETDTHFFSTEHQFILCPRGAEYTITLEYFPPSDTITFRGNGITLVGQDGFAQVTYTEDCWDWFPFTVSGSRNSVSTEYTVTIDYW